MSCTKTRQITKSESSDKESLYQAWPSTIIEKGPWTYDLNECSCADVNVDLTYLSFLGVLQARAQGRGSFDDCMIAIEH